MRIYVAGPIRSSGEPAQNVRRAIEAGQTLLERGHAKTTEEWLRLDFAWLEQCEALFRLPGYSAGANKECAHADKLGIPVFYDLDAIPDPR